MHHHCLVKYRRQRNSCPSCNKAWPQDAKDKQLLPVGENAAKDGQDGKRQTRMRSAEQSEEEDAEGEPPSQESAPQNGARKGRKKPVRVTDSMELDPAEDIEPSQPQKTRRSSRR